MSSSSTLENSSRHNNSNSNQRMNSSNTLENSSSNRNNPKNSKRHRMKYGINSWGQEVTNSCVSVKKVGIIFVAYSQ